MLHSRKLACLNSIWVYWSAFFSSISVICSIEKSDNLPRNVFPPCLLVVHYTRRSCEHNIAKLTGRKKLDNPFLKICNADIEAGGDDAGFVETGHED